MLTWRVAVQPPRPSLVHSSQVVPGANCSQCVQSLLGLSNTWHAVVCAEFVWSINTWHAFNVKITSSIVSWSRDATKAARLLSGLHTRMPLDVGLKHSCIAAVRRGAPALIVVILVLLYLQVGWATFVGLGVMVLFAPISGESTPAGAVCDSICPASCCSCCSLTSTCVSADSRICRPAA